MAKKFYTNYLVAVEWLNMATIRCNNIGEIDPSIYDNMRFDMFYEDEDGEHETEIYQFYLTSASDFDVQFLEEHFGLLFTYSDLLDMYVLCVDHYGTSWDYVTVETDLETAARELGQHK